MERGRLHIAGNYPRPADNAAALTTPFDVERPTISVDPGRGRLLEVVAEHGIAAGRAVDVAGLGAA